MDRYTVESIEIDAPRRRGPCPHLRNAALHLELGSACWTWREHEQGAAEELLAQIEQRLVAGSQVERRSSLRGEIERITALPTRDEMLARLHARSRVKLRTSAAEVIRKERESA